MPRPRTASRPPTLAGLSTCLARHTLKSSRRNTMKAETEIWQVKSGEEVYQADLTTLKQWVGEGLVQPTDMVRKGGLKWIEAGRAPGLRRVFTGEEQPPPPQPDATAAFEAQPATAAFEP